MYNQQPLPHKVPISPSARGQTMDFNVSFDRLLETGKSKLVSTVIMPKIWIKTSPKHPGSILNEVPKSSDRHFPVGPSGAGSRCRIRAQYFISDKCSCYRRHGSELNIYILLA